MYDIVDSADIYPILSIKENRYFRQVDVLIEFQRATHQKWCLRGVFGFCSSETQKTGIPSMSQDPKT